MIKYEIQQLDDTCGYWITKDVIEVEPVTIRDKVLFWTVTSLDYTDRDKDVEARKKIYHALSTVRGHCRIRRLDIRVHDGFIDRLSWYTVWENNKWIA